MRSQTRLAVFLIFMSMGWVSAQDLEDSDALINQLNTNDALFLKNPAVNNTVFLRQQGFGNEVFINQTDAVSNYVLVSQHRNQNISNITQKGSEIRSVVYQWGTANRTTLDLTGYNILTGVGQLGWYNHVDLELTGSNLTYGILQVGYGHEIIDTRNESDVIGLGFQSNIVRIRQSGRTARLIIRSK